MSDPALNYRGLKVGDRVSVRARPETARFLWHRTGTVSDLRPSAAACPSPLVSVKLDEPAAPAEGFTPMSTVQAEPEAFER